MHAVLLTLIALGGGADVYASGRITQSSADLYHASASMGGGACAGGNCGKGHNHGIFGDGHMGGWFGHMPQTCYSPRYGCYYGGNRHMHRYPAFHGTFYRRPYNYRNLFEYPWHAEMHEPTSLFSYQVMGQEGNAVNPPLPPPPVAPEQVYESAQRLQSLPPVHDQAMNSFRLPSTTGGQRLDLTDPNVAPAARLRR